MLKNKKANLQIDHYIFFCRNVTHQIVLSVQTLPNLAIVWEHNCDMVDLTVPPLRERFNEKKWLLNFKNA